MPFPVESALSGVMRAANDNRNYLFYRRTFTVPAGWSGRRVQLHFGAVDWQTTVWVNGVQVGAHTGGYDAFTFDITAAAQRRHQRAGRQGVGPQRHPAERQPASRSASRPRRPNGIFYTPSSGIWQTVWLEPTPAASISSVDLYPNLANNTLRVRVFTRGDVSGHTVLRRGAQRRHGRRLGHRRLHRLLRAGAERPPLVAGRPVPLQPAGHAAQRRRRRGGPDHALLRHAGDHHRHRQRRAAAAAQRAVRLPDRHARPGLLAGRRLHRAHRRGARLRPAEAQGPRLQHGAQAHQGGAAALVLPRRPARPAGLAGRPVA